MVSRPRYQKGRLSAPAVGAHGGERPGRPEYDLIAQLRAARVEGDEALWAAEEYDPDFSVKLSACRKDVDASQLLDEWLEHRVGILKRTQARLRQIWETARSGDWGCENERLKPPPE
jgi:hypothetical protein